MVLDAFTIDELNSINIREYEINFINQTYENDKIDIFKKNVKNYYYVEGRIGDVVVFRSVIKTKKVKIKIIIRNHQ